MLRMSSGQGFYLRVSCEYSELVSNTEGTEKYKRSLWINESIRAPRYIVNSLRTEPTSIFQAMQ